MKKLATACFILILAGIFTGAPLYAKPERMSLQPKQQKALQKLSRKNAGVVRLSRVQDPEARKALKVLFDAMNLKTQN